MRDDEDDGTCRFSVLPLLNETHVLLPVTSSFNSFLTYQTGNDR